MTTQREREGRSGLPPLDELQGILPRELRVLVTWLPWVPLSRGNGKLGKVPALPRNGLLKPVDWREAGLGLREAHDLAHLQGAGGIGVVLAPERNLTVLDLDLPLTGLAHRLLRETLGYAERSPGGGVHLWLAGTLPRSCRLMGVELLGAGFVTVTGDALQGRSRDLAPLGRVLPWLPAAETAPERPLPTRPALPIADHEVLQRLLGARNGARARQLLLEGNWAAAGYSSPSEADLAAARLLRFYTRDADQIQRLLLDSGLRRDKWAQGDYLARTVAHAIKLGGPQWSPCRSQ